MTIITHILNDIIGLSFDYQLNQSDQSNYWRRNIKSIWLSIIMWRLIQVPQFLIITIVNCRILSTIWKYAGVFIYVFFAVLFIPLCIYILLFFFLLIKIPNIWIWFFYQMNFNLYWTKINQRFGANVHHKTVHFIHQQT